jgi:hypothetical protein
MGDRVPIQVQPFDELEKRVGIMQAHPFDNPGLLPVKMSGAFLGQVPVRGMGEAQDCSVFAQVLKDAQADIDQAAANLADLNSKIRATTDPDAIDALYKQVDPLTMAWNSAKTNYDQIYASYVSCVAAGAVGSITREIGRPAPMLGQVPLRRPYNFGPMNEEELLSQAGYAMVNPLALSYTTGAYIQPGAPQYGRFPTMPPGIVYYR